MNYGLIIFSLMMLMVYGKYNINGQYAPPCTNDNGTGNDTFSQSGGSAVNATTRNNTVAKVNGVTNGYGSYDDTGTDKAFKFSIETDGTHGISTKDYTDSNSYIVGQTSTGITRVNAPNYKDIEFTIDGQSKMMVNPQGKVYINTDDHNAHFSEQLNVNGNILTNGAYIGSKTTNGDTAMLIGNAKHMTNPNTHGTNFGIAHHQDGTTRINSTRSLHFAINGDTQMLVKNGMVGINEINPKAPVHIKGNVRIDGDMTVNGNLASEMLKTKQYNNRLTALEQKNMELNNVIESIKKEHNVMKNKITKFTPTISFANTINDNVNLLSQTVVQLQKNTNDLQSKINHIRQKLDSVMNVSNISDIHDVYEQLKLLQEDYKKLNNKLTLLMSH